MKVLIMGGNGFTGSHLAPMLREFEYDVYSLERHATDRYVLGGQRLVNTVFGDLCDHLLFELSVKSSPDAVTYHRLLEG